jgi:hypothetical protein
MVSRFSRSKIPSAGQKTKIRRRERANHKSLAKERPDLVRQWHRSKNLPLTPSDVTAGMETYVWWKCPKGPDHVWRAKVLARAYRGSACPFCANRQVSVKSSLAVLAPKVAQEWHESKNGSVGPAEVVPGSGKMAWWRCRFGHEWRATIVQRTRVGTGCPSCSGRQVTPDRTLAVVAPAVARTWHPSKNGARKPSDARPSTPEPAGALAVRCVQVTRSAPSDRSRPWLPSWPPPGTPPEMVDCVPRPSRQGAAERSGGSAPRAPTTSGRPRLGQGASPVVRSAPTIACVAPTRSQP